MLTRPWDTPVPVEVCHANDYEDEDTSDSYITTSLTYSPHNNRKKCHCSRCSQYFGIYDEMDRKMLLEWADEVHEKFAKRYLRHLGRQRKKQAINRLNKIKAALP
jgi:hypothetical protein